MNRKAKQKLKRLCYKLRLRELVKEQRNIYKILHEYRQLLQAGKDTDAVHIVEVIYNKQLCVNETWIDWYYNQVYQ